MIRWLTAGWRADFEAWRIGACSWWQALWGHQVEPWWAVPGFMRRFARPVEVQRIVMTDTDQWWTSSDGGQSWHPGRRQ